MKLKTAHAQEILRYLALGDLEMVKKEAEELERVTVEAGFDGKDEEYRGYGREFLRTVRRLTLEAANGNLAGAYYQFSRMTGVCFACHEHMRGK
ncbi:MAG: hypothetical protein QHI48_11245 [Bacteroidota bacterium]|nr:hypothetical protein [Bacteroidota bacterium]